MSNGRLHGGFVKGIPLNEMRSTTDQFADAIAVAGEEGDVVAIIEQHAGEMTCDVAASADQKK